MLSCNERMSAFDLIFFDLKKGSIEKIIMDDDFIKMVYDLPCSTKGYSEEIGRLYFEKKGYKVKEEYKNKKHPVGFPDLEIELNGEKRFVEMKAFPDTVKFNQIEYLFELQGIIGYVMPRQFG